MLRLDTVNRKLQIYLGAAVATNQLPVVVGYSDKATTTYVGSTKRSLTNGVTAVDICEAPAAATVRDIDLITVVNTDTAPATVTIVLDDNGTDAAAFTATLEIGSQINFTHGQGFKVIDSGGAPQIKKETFQLKASTAIAINDAVGLGPDGRGYPISVTDYAAVTNCTYGTAQTSTATGRIVAQTQVHSDFSSTSQDDEQRIVQGDNGDLFMTRPYSTTNGIVLARYSAGGALLGTVDVNTNASVTYNPCVLKLANGNIAAVWGQDSNIRYAVYTAGLTLVVASTNLTGGVGNASHVFATVALSGGGFAVVYQPSTGGGLETYFAAFNNSGVVVVAAATIWTRTGSAGYPNYRIAELSNGNLAIVAHMTGVTGAFAGQWHGVYTTAGVVVAAFTQVYSQTAQYQAWLKVSGAYYAIASKDKGSAASHDVYIFDNAGVQQGATYTRSDSGMGSQAHFAAGADAFWYLSARASDSRVLLAKIPYTGGAAATVADVTTTGPSSYGFITRIFVDNGLIVGVFKQSLQQYLFVMSEASGALVNAAATAIGAACTSNNQSLCLIPGGDFSFIAYYDIATTASTNFVVGKFANTSVVGVAASAAAVNDYANIQQSAGTYPVNTLKGTGAVGFDHTTGATIYGNKGALMTNGVSLRGM
jgi:hypothetical protein